MPTPVTEIQDAGGFANRRVYPAEVLSHPPLAGTSQKVEQAGVAGINIVDGPGVSGESVRGAGVVGESNGHDGVRGRTHHKDHAGVAGVNDGGGIGVFGQGVTAGYFDGNVTITGDLTMINGGDIRLADFAEDFDATEKEGMEPGTVVIFDQNGGVEKSRTAYDKRVAGVISGAGNFRPAITLDRCKSKDNRVPVALMGKVFCKVDADSSPIEAGDLLTTSSTPGHAMKAGDMSKAFGTVIGKALQPVAFGKDMIPILVTLQ